MEKVILSVCVFLALTLVLWQFFLRDLKITGSAKLFWNAAQEEDVTGYRIYYGTSKRIGNCPQGGYNKKIDVGNKTSHKFEKLENGQRYYFSVTSINSAGKESCFSEEMSKEIRISFFDKIKSVFKK